MKHFDDELGFLLGIDTKDRKVYLSPTPTLPLLYHDFGLIRKYNNRGKMSLKEFTSWKDDIGITKTEAYDHLIQTFSKLTIEQSQLLDLCVLMETFYKLKAEVNGYSYIIHSKPELEKHSNEELKDITDKYNEYIFKIFPELFDKINKLLNN